MTASEASAPRPSALIALLRRPRYEVLPIAGTLDLVEQHVPTTLPVTVTVTTRRGLEPTLTLTEDLARRGYPAVPHLAARLVRDEQHLTDVLGRLDAVGVRDVFVVAGDGEPIGGFPDAGALLTAIDRLSRGQVAHRPTSLGIAGYPEGHPLITFEELDRALVAKQRLGDYVVTQMCFDAAAVTRWIGRMQSVGVALPVHVGVAGPIDRLRLLRVATRIGVGSSLRYARKQRGGAELLRAGGYRPDALLTELGGGVAGLHVYTLGDVAATERWRLGLIDRLTDGTSGG